MFLGLLQNIDISKASGQDQISGRMLKATATSIVIPVTKLFNKSISTGCFPTMWKQSNIVPIPKSGDKGNPTNYWPISLLPVMNKLLERHIANLVLQHLMVTQPIFLLHSGDSRVESPQSLPYWRPLIIGLKYLKLEVKLVQCFLTLRRHSTQFLTVP